VGQPNFKDFRSAHTKHVPDVWEWYLYAAAM
jgi:hypothetical protein